MDKLREFTIIEAQEKTYQALEYRKSHDQLVNQTHVIEYSAYEQLKKENNKLIEQNAELQMRLLREVKNGK